MKKKIVCIIPARSGSKRIKNKNFIKIKNLRLIKYIFKNIIKSKEINSFFLASDDKKIYNHIDEYKNKVNFFQRSSKSSSSNAKSELVLEEFLKIYKNFDIVVFVQATNPFIDHLSLDKAIKKFVIQKYDSLLSVAKSKSFLWQKKFPTKALNYDYKKRKMTQDLSGYYIENGSFYIFYRKNFLKYKNRLHKKIGTYEMPKESMIEIDEIEDLKIVRKLLS